MEWHAIWSYWVSGLLDASVKAAVLFAFAALAARAFGRASAAVRHVIWLLALAGAAALPLFSRFLPAWQPAWLPPLSLGGAAAITPEQTASAALHSVLAGVNWLAAAAFVWALVAVVLLVRLFLAWLMVWRIANRATPVDADWRMGTVGWKRQVRLLASAEIDTPMTSGVFRPTLLVPSDFGEWPAERRRAALLHELAHIARFDTLVQTAARLVAIVHWFNPLAWLAVRALREECERACDDRVLAAGIKASDYARDLLDLACALEPPRFDSLAVAMARRTRLHARLLAILDERASRRPITEPGVLAALVVALALVAPLAALRPSGVEGPRRGGSKGPAAAGPRSQVAAAGAVPRGKPALVAGLHAPAASIRIANRSRRRQGPAMHRSAPAEAAQFVPVLGVERVIVAESDAGGQLLIFAVQYEVRMGRLVPRSGSQTIFFIAI